LSAEDAAERERAERAQAAGFTTSRHQQWADRGDEGRSGDEMRALDLFDLPPDCSFDEVRKAWRQLAKETHPDVCPDDADAAKRFHAGQAAFEVLRQAEERRSWKPA
jgi:DnaJ-class molecular chaperone